VQESKNHL